MRNFPLWSDDGGRVSEEAGEEASPHRTGRGNGVTGQVTDTQISGTNWLRQHLKTGVIQNRPAYSNRRTETPDESCPRTAVPAPQDTWTLQPVQQRQRGGRCGLEPLGHRHREPGFQLPEHSLLFGHVPPAAALGERRAPAPVLVMFYTERLYLPCETQPSRPARVYSALARRPTFLISSGL